MSGKDIDSLFSDGKLATITFITADASFAVPLEQVMYIEKDVKRNLQVNELDEFNHEVITFQNNTVQLYDFNKLIGSENHQQSMQRLVTELDGYEQQHQDWVNTLEAAVKHNTPFNEVTEADKCSLGIWAANFETDNEELLDAIQRLQAPHEKLHKLAKKLIAMTDKDEALKTLEQERQSTLTDLSHLFHLARERALSSVRPIILFVEHNDSRVTALRLDNINDIVTFDKSVFCRDDSTEGIMKTKTQDFLIEGFLRNGNDAPLMLINCQPSGLAMHTEQVA